MLDQAQAERIGRYELRRAVGTGSLGTVYLAELNGAGRFSKSVALKIIRPDLDDWDAVHSMFCDEARIASRIEHPNVCSVFDFGEHGDALYLAMEYLQGRSLEAVLRRLARHAHHRAANRFLPMALKVMSEAAEGIHAAHQVVDTLGKPMEVVHRDVSPRNIFLTSQGGVRITDFGVSGAVGQRLQTTSTRFRGRIPYRSPESFRGLELDAGSDLWALGVVLFELLTGTHPFLRPTDAATMHAILEGRVPSPSEYATALPSALDRVVTAVLERDRAARLTSAGDLAQELSRVAWSLGEPVSTQELRAWYDALFRPDEGQLADPKAPRAKAADTDSQEAFDNAPTTLRHSEAPPRTGTAPKPPRQRPTGNPRAASEGVAGEPSIEKTSGKTPSRGAPSKGSEAKPVKADEITGPTKERAETTSDPDEESDARAKPSDSARRRTAGRRRRGGDRARTPEPTVRVSRRGSMQGLTTAALLVATLATVSIVAFAVFFPRLTRTRSVTAVLTEDANTEQGEPGVRDPAPGTGAVRIRTLSGRADVYEVESDGSLRRLGRTPLLVDLRAGESSLQIWHDTGERERRTVQVVEGAQHLIAIP